MLGANDFILRVFDKGYAIPFITFPHNAFFDNNHSALMHADFVLEAIHELILSGSVVQVSSPPHVVNPLSVSIQSCGKKRLILDLRHVNKHIWKEKFKFEDIRKACVYLPFDHFMFPVKTFLLCFAESQRVSHAFRKIRKKSLPEPAEFECTKL